MPNKDNSNQEQLLEMADKVGSFIEYWGFKKVHGKLWTLIFLSPEPVDANYLIDSLNISKALTSMSLKDLIQYNVIHEVEKDRPGTQKYCINPDLTQVILDIINQREVVMLKKIQQAHTQLEKASQSSQDSNIDPGRLKELGQMVSSAYSLLEGMTGAQKVDFKEFDQAMSVKG